MGLPDAVRRTSVTRIGRPTAGGTSIVSVIVTGDFTATTGMNAGLDGIAELEAAAARRLEIRMRQIGAGRQPAHQHKEHNRAGRDGRDLPPLPSAQMCREVHFERS